MNRTLRRLFACRSEIAAVVLAALLVGTRLSDSRGAEAPRALPPKKLPDDRRLGPLQTLNGYFPFHPPATKDEWNQRVEHDRRQVLVSQGLWPMPTKTPANAVVHGLVDRPEYTIERVYLESYPGHYVTGSLFRPKGKTGRLPGVLCPYGHWANGRFYDAGVKSVRQQIVDGAERFEESGRYPLQARCVQLARMGCVVFHYDMVGVADSKQIPGEISHGFSKRRSNMETPDSWGFFSPQAELRLQNIMGLQSYNSIRALDWFSELPDVDPKRIGVTGASGGGTQTFILGAIDPRPAVAFPAVMVSTAMQGGCTCENAPYLRVGMGNIELAALFAPKPLGMTGADDWTIEIATKGLPELKQLYKLLGNDKLVMARPLNHFGHNYNHVSRAAMYGWMNRHLGLGFEEPVVEQDFKPQSIAELTVWDASHPRPEGGEEYERKLVRWMTDDADKQIAALAPRDEKSLAEYRRVVGGAIDVLIGRGLPDPKDIEYERVGETDRGDYVEYTALLRNRPQGEELPTVFLQPKKWNKQVVIWVDAQGKSGLYATDGLPKPEIAKLLAAGTAVASADLLYQGEFNAPGKELAAARRVSNDRDFSGYTTCYNHPLFSQRVHDVLTLISFVKNHQDKPQRVDLVGIAGAGAWAAAACDQAGEAIDRVAIDTAGFRFGKLKSYDDVNFLPGAAKYGDVPAMLALAAPHAMWLAGEGKDGPAIVHAAYQAAGQGGRLTSWAGDKQDTASAAVDWLLK